MKKVLLLIFLMIFAVPGIALSASINDQVWFVFSDSETPPDAAADWQPVELPDSWNKTQNSRGGNGWYRIRRHFDAVPSEVWGLLLERVNMNASAFIGAHFLGDGGSFEEPVSRNWARPLLFNIDPSLLHVGNNDIYVRVFSYAQHAGGLQIYHWGVLSEIKEKYQSAYHYYITLSQLIAGVQALLALLLLMLWLGRRGDTKYLWLSAATLISVMFSVNIFIQTLPVPQWLWLWLAQISFGWFNGCMLMVAHRYFDMHRPKLEKWIACVAVGGAVILLLLPENILIASIVVWQFLFGLINVYILYISVNQCRHKAGMHEWGWLGGYALLFALFMHDRVLIAVNQGFHFQMMFHLGVFVFVLCVFVMLGARFVQTLNSEERHESELSGKITSVKAEAEKEQKQAILDERRRIMRDLHDGLGNSLVSAMALSMDEKNNRLELQEILQEAMSEMRLLVASSTHAEFDFKNALTLVKERTKLSLMVSGIVFNWQAEQLLMIQNIHKSVTGIHVLRILQEALTNAMKHANASKVDVVASLDDGVFRLCVSDNGVGLSDVGDGGNGLQSMKTRAESIGATLSVRNNASGGTTVMLLLPEALSKS